MSYYPPSLNLKFEKPTREEEQELFRRLNAGDAEAREKIIRFHLLFVADIAKKYAAGALPDEDVISTANEILIRVVDQKKFDATLGNRFTSYLRPFVRGAVFKLFKEASKFVPLPENPDAPVPNVAAGIETMEEPQTGAEDFKEFIHKALEASKISLKDEEKQILTLMYEQGLNMAEVGRRMKITREWVRQKHDEILSKLRRSLHKKGIDHR